MSVLSELRTVRRGSGRRGRQENLAAYLFLLPWLVGLVLVTIGPMLASLFFSFTEYNLIRPPRPIGLDNYADMLQDERLLHSVTVTVTYAFVGVPAQLAVALLVAVALDRGMRGLPFYRSVLYLPSMLGSSVAIAILWRQIFGTEGLVNQVLGLFGIEGRGWISDPDTALFTIILLHVWTFGTPMLIFLAGLRQIPAMYHEAASIDGASSWQRFWRVTMPLLSPIILFNLVMQLIGAFQSFTQAFIVSGGTGGPADSTLFYSLYLYQRGFGQLDMGYASAMAWFLVIIVGAITGINFLAAKYWVFYDD